MYKKPLVMVNNHVEKVNITLPSASIITRDALGKLHFALKRCENKFWKKMHEARVPECWTGSYIEELTPDRCVFVVVYGFGILDPTQEHIKYEVNTHELLDNLTPEKVIKDE